MHDLIIRGGTIVDGTGGERFVGDVAIDGDRIVAVGKGVKVPVALGVAVAVGEGVQVQVAVASGVAVAKRTGLAVAVGRGAVAVEKGGTVDVAPSITRATPAPRPAPPRQMPTNAIATRTTGTMTSQPCRLGRNRHPQIGHNRTPAGARPPQAAQRTLPRRRSLSSAPHTGHRLARRCTCAPHRPQRIIPHPDPSAGRRLSATAPSAPPAAGPAFSQNIAGNL